MWDYTRYIVDCIRFSHSKNKFLVKEKRIQDFCKAFHSILQKICRWVIPVNSNWFVIIQKCYRILMLLLDIGALYCTILRNLSQQPVHNRNTLFLYNWGIQARFRTSLLFHWVSLPTMLKMRRNRHLCWNSNPRLPWFSLTSLTGRPHSCVTHSEEIVLFFSS